MRSNHAGILGQNTMPAKMTAANVQTKPLRRWRHLKNRKAPTMSMMAIWTIAEVSDLVLIWKNQACYGISRQVQKMLLFLT